jgi:type I restriction enzyme, R subunit
MEPALGSDGNRVPALVPQAAAKQAGGSRRALYDNLGQDEFLALAVDSAVLESRQDDWRGNAFKIKKVMFAIKAALQSDDALTAKILDLVKNQREY